MKKIEDLNYYELLEISPTATAQEIHKAYERIRRMYEPNSIALYSLFTPEETAGITQRIEEAYRTLVYEEQRRKYDAMLRGHDDLPDLPPIPQEIKYQPSFVQPMLTLPSENRYLAAQETPAPQPAPPKPAPMVEPVTQFVAEFTGPAIRMVREQKGLTLRHVSDSTKIGTRYLECIEGELFPKLPARAYIRGFLMLYAKALGCEPERMAGDYLKRYDGAMKPVKK